jgi:hypothetical protein
MACLNIPHQLCFCYPIFFYLLVENDSVFVFYVEMFQIRLILCDHIVRPVIFNG